MTATGRTGTTARASDGESVVIQLDATTGEGGVVTVTPHDQDRFVLRVDEAIEACQKAKTDERSRLRFDLLLKRLATWVLGRPGDLRDAYVTLRDGGLCFIAIHSTPKYDAEFEDALSELDLEIAHDPDIPYNVDVISLPPISGASMDSFLATGLTLRFDGNSA